MSAEKTKNYIEKRYDPEDHHTPEINHAIQNTKEFMLEDVEHHLAQHEISSSEEANEIIQSYQIDETAVISLSIDEKIDLIELYADDYDLELSHVKPDNIRGILESISAHIIYLISESKAMEEVKNLFDFMEKNDLTVDNIVPSNQYWWARHYWEREEGDHCQVYEYRNIEEEQIHVDVYEYKRGGMSVTFDVFINDNDVSFGERYFDAT